MYASLHNRSAYSFGLALTRPAELAAFAAGQGMPAIALTDLDGLYAAVAFQEACEQAGVKPIFGAEVDSACSTARLTLLAQDAAGYSNLCRLVSLRHLRDAPLGEGDLRDCAEGLICLVGMRRAPPGSWPGAGQPANRMVRAGLAGPPPAPVDATPSECVLLRKIFPDRLYVELAIHGGQDVAAARRRARMADELGIPVVATCDSRCVSRSQGPLLQALSSIATLTLLDQPHEEKPAACGQPSAGTRAAGNGRGVTRRPSPFSLPSRHLRTPGEMERLFARRPDALANTLRIAGQCNVHLDLSRNRFPPFTSPDGRRAIEQLRALGVAGCRRRYVEEPPLRGIGGRRPALEEALARLDRELGIIEQVHYAEYFLVFHEINQECRRRGIATLARGSAADSLICYALGVSHACPFRFDLPFDRFINPERARFSKLADIDLDLPWDRRDEIIEWVYERWGSDRVAMIGCANTYHARAAVAELGKVYGLPAHEVHRVTKLLTWMTSTDLVESIARRPEAREAIFGPAPGTGKGTGGPAGPAGRVEEPYRTILRMARDLEGLPRHWSMHPCGLVVSPSPLTEMVPVQPSAKGPLVAQYDMDAIEDLGFVKIDLLGQAGLSVLRDAVESINRDSRSSAGGAHPSIGPGAAGPPARASKDEWRMEKVERGPGEAAASPLSACPDPPACVDLSRDVDYSDATTWEMIAGGNARGVHHIESPAMTSLLQQCDCRDIDCLTAVVAIIRPGAANQGKKEAFARRYQGMEPPVFAHPALRPVLETTYGLMVFEEHILQVAVDFAGMNLGRADVLRRALNKENRAMVRELGAEFRAAALARGRRPEEIDVVWATVEGFCGFMFNKAHSAEYAVEAFQGAWLKRRWPAHYLAAILSNYRGFYASSPTLPQILYVLEALRLGIGFAPPCVNRSGRKFAVEESAGGGGPARDAGASSWVIRVPVTHIHGLSEALLGRYLAERERGLFGSLEDFIDRCRPGESEAMALLDSGAFDGLGGSRPVHFWGLRRLLRHALPGGPALWSPPAAAEEAPPVALTVPGLRQIAERETELLGFPVSVHPLVHLGTDEQGNTIDWSRYTPLAELGRHTGRCVEVCGLMAADRVNATQRHELMKFVTLGDHTAFVEALLFPDSYQRFGHLTAAHPVVAARGVVEPFENGKGFTLRVLSLSPPAKKKPAMVTGPE